MSIDIWPPVSPETFKDKRAASQARELEWILNETRTAMTDIRHGLQECYALLAPVDPGSTLVLSTPRAEKVKGYITRVGTRVVKGTIHLQLRHIQASTITIDPTHPIHIPQLESLHDHLSESLDLLSLSLAESSDPAPATPRLLSDHLHALSTTLTSAASLLKGNSSLPHPTPPQSEQLRQADKPLQPPPDQSWQFGSCPPRHFAPPLPPGVSFHLSLQDASLTLHLRGLEPVDAPVNFGLKLGLALGTFRRLEHDEMDHIYPFRYSHLTDGGGKHVHQPDGSVVRKSPSGTLSSQQQQQQQQSDNASTRSGASGNGNGNGGRQGSGLVEGGVSSGWGAGFGPEPLEVWVREKVKVETADPSLLSLYAKLVALANTLAQARRNLAAVMGEEIQE